MDSQEGIDEIRKELLDRFGSLPLEVENLLLVSRLRVLASSLCIASIHHENGQINVKFDQEQKFDTLKLWRLVKQYSGRMKLTSGKEVMLKIRPYGGERRNISPRELEDLLVLVREVVIEPSYIIIYRYLGYPGIKLMEGNYGFNSFSRSSVLVN